LAGWITVTGRYCSGLLSVARVSLSVAVGQALAVRPVQQTLLSGAMGAQGEDQWANRQNANAERCG
jgi:hypothetical protein